MLVITIFIIGYLIIILENYLKLDKSIPALLMGALCWAAVSMGHLPLINAEGQDGTLEPVLLHHTGKIAEILIFLLGAMTIVELIDLHQGFRLIVKFIKTKNKVKLLWIIGFLAFFLSALIDNLTTAIVFVSILRKLIPDKNERLLYISLVVIASNAGGAWSPIGDVTTTMLWVSGQITSLQLVTTLFIPSILSMAVPLGILSFSKKMKGNIQLSDEDAPDEQTLRIFACRTILFVGLGSLLFVPVFKQLTHLPPYIGMMIGLAVTWLVSEYIHPNEDFDRKKMYSVHNALSRIELSSILFFLGILLAVASLEATGTLHNLADMLDTKFHNHSIVAILLGFASAVVDNVPLVAAAQGMYTLPTDDFFWHFLAYSAGTGGSMLIVGSAAGVAVSGMEKVSFGWYFKNISLLALVGFLAGCLWLIVI